MKKIILIIALLMYSLTAMAFAADVVQIATTRDDSGKWDNWVAQAVTWDATVLVDAPDHNSISLKSLQTWLFPVGTGFITATFDRPILGKYALRWSRDGIFFSEPAMVEIQKPKPGQNK